MKFITIAVFLFSSQALAQYSVNLGTSDARALIAKTEMSITSTYTEEHEGSQLLVKEREFITSDSLLKIECKDKYVPEFPQTIFKAECLLTVDRADPSAGNTFEEITSNFIQVTIAEESSLYGAHELFKRNGFCHRYTRNFVLYNSTATSTLVRDGEEVEVPSLSFRCRGDGQKIEQISVVFAVAE